MIAKFYKMNEENCEEGLCNLTPFKVKEIGKIEEVGEVKDDEVVAYFENNEDKPFAVLDDIYTDYEENVRASWFGDTFGPDTREL